MPVLTPLPLLSDSMIKNRVKNFREDQNITQQQLAESCGVSRQTIIAIEKGNYEPSLGLALKIARYFKLKIEDIFVLQ